MNEQFIQELDALKRRVLDLETQERIPILARYTATALQSIPNATPTKLNLETIDYDTWTACSVGSGWRFTAPISGYYIVAAHVYLGSSTNWNTGEQVLLTVYKNGSPYDVIGEWTAPSTIATGFQTSVGGDSLAQLDITEYVELYCTQNSGAAGALRAGVDTDVHVFRIVP